MGANKPLASVARALRILEFLAVNPADGVPLTAISKELGINKATVHNTLATLREYHWVEQDESTGHYRLGEGIRPIANYKTTTERVVEALHPALAAVSLRFNELVHLGALTGQHIVYLDKVEPDRAIRVVSQIGREASAVRTSLGRALIGVRPDREAELPWFLSDPGLDGESPAGLKELERAVRENFARLDEEGWTQEIGECEPGIACVAIPLTIGKTSHVAISISTPIERMPESQRHAFVAGMAEEIARLPRTTKATLPKALR